MNESNMNAVSTDTEQIKLEVSGARGAGLSSMAAALASVGITGTNTSARARAFGDTGAMPIATACATVERPAGDLLQAVQGHLDLHLCQACAKKLKGRMAGDGHEVTAEMLADGVQAGLLALAQWRAGAGAGESSAARVAWRAIVTELSQDRYGDSVSLDTVQEDWLWHNAESQSESRQERAARIWVERMASTRQTRLQRRLSSLPAGRGKRQAAIDKIGNAAAMLLQGERMETAATMAGFKGSERGHKATAGDRLIQAAKRIGLIVKTGAGGQQFTARMSTREDGERRGEFVAMSTARGERLFTYQAGESRGIVPAMPAGNHCGASCLAAAIVRGVRRSASSERSLKRRVVHGDARFTWSQLSPVARLQALPAGTRRALVWAAMQRGAGMAVAPVAKRGLMA